MRLCLNDSGIGGPYRTVTKESLKKVHDIGFRVAGVQVDEAATDDDIRRMKDLLLDVGLSPGPSSAGCAPFHPDPAVTREWKKKIVTRLKIAGKMGIPCLRLSGGSMNPDNRWAHHPQNHTQKALDLYVRHTKEVAGAAEDYGVMLCPETTNWTILDTIERMKEYVDRVDSPCVKVVFDIVNKLTAHTVYQNARFSRCAIATLGDRIGVLHVKDVMVPDLDLVSHIDEAPMGTGILDHAAIIRASNQLEPWKTFSLEHFSDKAIPVYDQWVRAYKHIMAVSERIGHEWTDPACTRERWERENIPR